MSGFDKVKQDVKTQVHDFEVKAETEVKTNLTLVIVTAVVALLLGFIAGKLF